MSRIRPEQIPTDLKQSAMDAGWAPDAVSKQAGGSVTYGPGTLVCAAPPNAEMRVSFFNEGGCYIDGETVAACKSRIIAPRGASFQIEIMIPEAPDGDH